MKAASHRQGKKGMETSKFPHFLSDANIEYKQLVEVQ